MLTYECNWYHRIALHCMIFLAMTKVINRCALCQKELGTSFCTGCGVYFCTKDFKSHRESLFTELNSVIEHHNDFQDKIDKAVQHDGSHIPLFKQVDQWEKTMTENIRLAAEHARDQISRILHSKWIKLSNDFKRFSNELVHLKETENFVEHDLTRLKYMIHQFNYQLKQLTKPLTIELHTKQSDRIVWSQLIYAEEKSTYARMQQRQQQLRGMMIN